MNYFWVDRNNLDSKNDFYHIETFFVNQANALNHVFHSSISFIQLPKASGKVDCVSERKFANIYKKRFTFVSSYANTRWTSLFSPISKNFQNNVIYANVRRTYLTHLFEKVLNKKISLLWIIYV